jgi:hypothetical protein
MNDNVNHPAHYTEGRAPHHEPIVVIEAWDLDFCIGNCVKYIARAGRKPGTDELEDLRKARWYLDRAIQQRTPEVMMTDEQKARLSHIDPGLPHG